MDWRWHGIKLSGKRIGTAPDFVVYDRLKVSGFDDRNNQFELDLRFSETLGRYYVRALALKSGDESDEITGARLRELPILALTRDALGDGGVVELAAGGIFELDIVADAAQSIVEGGPSSDEAMLATARVYRFAEILQRPPAKAVQDTLGLTAPTATLWIRRARSLGLLGIGSGEDG